MQNGLRNCTGGNRDGWRNTSELEPHLDGRKRVCGTPGLKLTQVYPEEFGDWLFKLWQTEEPTPMPLPNELDFSPDATVKWNRWQENAKDLHFWRHARFEDVASLFNVPLNAPM